MSDPTPTEPYRLLKSPFNGETWTVPPDMSPEMYDHMVKVAGFVPIESKAPKKARSGA